MVMNYSWTYEEADIDWNDMADVYRRAPLGNKSAKELSVVFANSRFKCFVSDENGRLVGAGRAIADGCDCSYICDVAIVPEHQGKGLGRQIMKYLLKCSEGYMKIIIFASPGKEGFYRKLGFRKMNTAMAVFRNEEYAVKVGLVE